MLKKTSFAVLIIIMILNIVSCSVTVKDTKMQSSRDWSHDITADNSPVHGGVLRLFSTKPDTLNPLLTENLYVKNFLGLAYESLVKLDRYQRPVPCLAESWDVSNDGLVWTFYLRKGVFWHDNMPLSAEDVEFTIQMIQNPDVKSAYEKNVENISGVTVVDEYTIKIRLYAPYAFTAENMTFPIIPKHRYYGENILTSPLNNEPIGTGPYKFIKYDAENFMITFAANDKWWNSGTKDPEKPGLPYIFEIQVKIYENAKSEMTAFQNREIDVAYVRSGQTSMYSIRSDVTLRKYPGGNFEFLTFNLSKPVLGDKNVRQAIAYAIDRLKLINMVLPGEAVVSDLPVIPDTWLNDSNVDSYQPDKQKAKKLLLEDGWIEYEGTMYKSVNGQTIPLSLEMLVNDDNITRCESAEKIAEMLKDIGIKVDIKKVDWYEELKLLDSRKFDIAFLGCRIASVPDISFLYSSSYTQPGVYNDEPAARNIAGYTNPTVDNYLNSFIAEKNSDKRKEIFFKIRKIINDELPYIGLYFFYEGMVYNKSLSGELSPYIWNPLNDITKWYIPITIN